MDTTKQKVWWTGFCPGKPPLGSLVVWTLTELL